MPTVADKYQRHAHYLERYYNGQVNKFLPFLKRVREDLSAELLKTNTVMSKKQIKAKLEFVNRLVLKEFGEYTDDIMAEVELFAAQEVEFATLSIADGVALEVIAPSSTQTIAAINAKPFNNILLKDYLNEFPKDQARAIRNAVSIGFYEGRPTPDIVEQIVGTKAQGYKNGFLNVSRTSARRMVRTALNHTASVARDIAFEKNKDLVPYYRWTSTLDGRTSAICKARDGLIYKVRKGPTPPAHFNCRSSTVPMFKNEVDPKTLAQRKDITGSRESVDGPVDANLNYNDWLKKQLKGFQNETLGKTKADLFRKGGLSVDKFVNNEGQELTLSQLRKKFPAAWEKAEI